MVWYIKNSVLCGLISWRLPGAAKSCGYEISCTNFPRKSSILTSDQRWHGHQHQDRDFGCFFVAEAEAHQSHLIYRSSSPLHFPTTHSFLFFLHSALWVSIFSFCFSAFITWGVPNSFIRLLCLVLTLIFVVWFHSFLVTLRIIIIIFKIVTTKVDKFSI